MAYDYGGSQPLAKQGPGYDSNEDVHAALQLSFEDSPDHSLSSHDPHGHHRQEASPSKKARSAVLASSTSQQRYQVHRNEHEQHQQQQHLQQQLDNASRFPLVHQHPPEGYAYHPAYHLHQIMDTTASQGFPHYPPSSSISVQGAAPSHFPGYQPHSAPGYHLSQPWQSPPHGQGHYMYHPQFQQQQMQQEQEQYPTPSASTPSGSRTPSKRKGLNDVDANATMETAELSYEDEMSGPFSPPSAKKTKDIDARKSSSNVWDSPSHVFRRGMMVRLTK
jgi:hypothetical protein